MSRIADIKINNGQPEKLQIQLTHYKQRFNWDCGISCVLMVLPKKCRQDLIKNFNRVCREEGFHKSTWTIDLCYVLTRFRVDHIFYTVTLGVHPGYRGHKFYSHLLTKDESRINRKFKNAMDNGIDVRKSSVSFTYIMDHLIHGPVIVLTNANLLHCDVCKMNKISTELRKCIPIPVPYQGHYIVVCGYDISSRKVFYRNPALINRVCAMSVNSFEEARKSYGTDEDIIFVFT